MNAEFYSIVALFARYVFAGMMALIVLSALRGTISDSSRASRLRRLLPQTGQGGTLQILKGGGRKARTGMTYTVIREGRIGRSWLSDVRILDRSIERRHAYFSLTPEGLEVRAHGGAPMYDRRGNACLEMLLKDGDRFRLGDVFLMLVLNNPGQVRPVRPVQTQDDDLFDPDEWMDDEDVRDRNNDAGWYRPSGRSAAPETVFDDEPDLFGDGFDERLERRKIERRIEQKYARHAAQASEGANPLRTGFAPHSSAQPPEPPADPDDLFNIDDEL